MPKVTEEHLESRRGQIMAAAIACFSEKGYHKTSMRDICKQAQLSAGAVYHYFKSKDEIIEAVAEMGQEMNQQVFESAKNSTDNINTRVEKNLDNYRDFLKQPMGQQCNRADIMFAAEALVNPHLETLGTRSYESIMSHLLELAEEWQKSGEINRALDSEAVAKVMFAVVQGLQLQTVIDPDMDIDTYFDVLKALFFGEFKINR